MLQFACNTGVLLIKSATYGRPMGRTYRCGENQNIVKKCTVDATQLLKYTCDNQLLCEIYVDVATFMTEMCPDARKFVDVVYECVPPRTVTTVNRCQQKCLPASAQPVSQMATKNALSFGFESEFFKLRWLDWSVSWA
nr:hypothetical protein BaRGS_034535 [Batillaria attramentaria]